jgi:hypothetical protein
MANQGVKTTMEWVIGISSIALVLLVTLIIFGNLSGNTGITTTATTTYTNETCFINTTGYTPTGVSTEDYISYAVTQIGYNKSVSGGYKVFNATAYAKTGDVLTNNTITLSGFEDSGCSYVVTYHSGEYTEAENIITNYSSGVSNLTKQIPTVLLFVGIALLLFVLIFVLAYVIKKMSSFGSGGSGGFASKGSVE